jgi:DNA polymerase III sliding clamp (beta) subunit (PCNA family)
MDMIQGIDEEKMIFQFTDANKPTKFTGEGNTDYIHLIMAMKG